MFLIDEKICKLVFSFSVDLTEKLPEIQFYNNLIFNWIDGKICEIDYNSTSFPFDLAENWIL